METLDRVREGALETLVAMADVAVAVARLDAVIPVDGADPDTVDRAVAWVDALVAAATSPTQTALARWASAVVAERAGEVTAAADDLALAVEAHRHFAPALDWAGRYAADRSDAAGALALWRALENPDATEFGVVAEVARESGRGPGRNGACWCGSGRKLKACHAGEPAPVPLTARVEWLWRKAHAYVSRRGGAARDDIVAAARARSVEPTDDESVAAALDDPIVLDAVLVEGGWFARFLADRSPLLPADEASLGRSWRSVRRTVYEVAGSGLVIRDRRTGDWLSLTEPSRRRDRPGPAGALLCGRAVPDGEGHRFVGRTFPVSPADEATVLALCDRDDPLALCAWVRALD